MGEPINPTTGENLLSSADAAAQAFVGFQERIQEIQTQLDATYGTEDGSEGSSASLKAQISDVINALLLGAGERDESGKLRSNTTLMRQILEFGVL